MPLLPAHITPVRFLPQENCHTQLSTVMQHTQPFAPTPWSRRAAGREQQLRECLCIAEERAAAALETTFKEKHEPGLPGWGSALTSSYPAAGLTEKQSWSCHDPPDSAEPSLPFCWVLLTCNCTTGQMKDLPKDLARDPSVKTVSTI